MLELTFAVTGVSTEPFAAAPALVFAGRATAKPSVRVEALVLRAQVQIEAAARAYTDAEAAALGDLFGPRSLFARSLGSVLWTHAQTSVRAFAGEGTFALPVPCVVDLNAAATRYFLALEGGVVPLAFYFSGTAFVREGDGPLGAVPLSARAEAHYAMPAAAFGELLERHRPGGVALVVGHDVLTRLLAYKTRAGHASLDESLARLLDGAQP